MEQPSPAILHIASSQQTSTQALGPYQITPLISEEQESGGTAYRVQIQPHQKTAVSYHKIAEEFYYVLSGSGTAMLNGRSYELHTGDFLRLPPNTTHSFETREEALTLLNTHFPGSRPNRDVYFVGETPEGFGTQA